MNRKQAKARGGIIYQMWLDGYKWCNRYSSPKISRNDYKQALKNQSDFVNEVTTEMIRAFTAGMMAHTRNALKKGKYRRA